MYHRSSRLRTAIVAFAFILAGIGCIWILIRANGYRVLVSPVRLVKTGLISIRTHPDSGVNIYLNGKLQSAGKQDFTDLTPGRYTIRITDSGFQTWERTAMVTAGQAVIYHDVTLFYSQPTKEEVTDQSQRQQYLPLLQDVSRFQHQLEVVGDEVWAGDQLVTRYSAPVTEALWYPDETHVLILVKNQLHAVELTQGHDTILFSLPDAKSIQYVPLAGGQKILVQADDQLFLYTVTDAYSLIPLPSF